MSDGINLWDDRDLEGLKGRTILEVIDKGHDGWGEIRFTDGSWISISYSDMDLGWRLYERASGQDQGGDHDV